MSVPAVIDEDTFASDSATRPPSQQSAKAYIDSRRHLGEPVALSGSGHTFTGIPSWAKRVRINFTGTSLTGTAQIFIRLGSSSGTENTGYTGSVLQITGSSVSSVGHSAGFQVTVGSAASATFEGLITFDLISAALNRWTANGNVGTTFDARVNITTGYKSISGVLDRVQILQNASDTFDSGQVNISWE